MPIYNLSIQEAETELLQVWNQFRLQSKTMSQNTHMHTQGHMDMIHKQS